MKSEEMREAVKAYDKLVEQASMFDRAVSLLEREVAQ